METSLYPQKSTLILRISKQLLDFIVVLLGFSAPLFSQVPVAVPNWNKPHPGTPGKTEESVVQAVSPSQRIEFSFTLASPERTTSAAVYDSNGFKVKTLWMNRAFEKGTFQGVWDGTDDSGKETPTGAYTVKLGYNNVNYEWQGIIGNTESSWSSYRSWDGVVASFIRSLTFINGKAYAATGYSESGYAAAVFPESSPNSEVTPLTKLVFNSFQHFMFAATDGKLVYFGFQTYTPKPAPWQGVIAFTPNGEYYPFPAGQQFPAVPKTSLMLRNSAMLPTTGIPDAKVVDVSPYPTDAVTGVAVERNGSLLATAHGYYQPPGRAAVPSVDKINLWDKKTGAFVGSLPVPNPQGMSFDLENNLWVISGYATHDVLYKVSDVGRANRMTTPVAGLSNPISISVNPATGTILVADGGTNQQIQEFDPKTNRIISQLGKKGGYVSNGTCNSSVDNDIFWFDPGPNVGLAHVVGLNSPFLSWVSAADNGDVWVGDFTTSRILHFKKAGDKWVYVDRIMYLPWDYNSSVPAANPDRVFAGPTGFLEFKVDYSTPLVPGDPEQHPGKRSWELVRNWLPCFVNQDPGSDLGNQMTAYSFPGVGVVGVLFGLSHDNRTLLQLKENGTLKVEHMSPLSGYTAFDASGNYYRLFVQPKGAMAQVSFNRYRFLGPDSTGFPTWDSNGEPLGGYMADHQKGDPIPKSQRATYWPSANGVIPVLDPDHNPDLLPGRVAFHLGGLRIHERQLTWKTMPEKQIPYTDGEGSFPAEDLRGKAQMGVNAWAMNSDIFTFYNGNSSRWGCQFYHFKDNGLFVGQFGFQTGPGYPSTGIGFGATGYPQKGTELPLAPGECIDVPQITGVQEGGNYYLYLGDETYHRGIHRWKISNLDSYGELSGAGALGTRFALKPKSSSAQ